MISRYITFRDKDDEGNFQYYILQRDFPHYIAQIESNPYGKALYKAPIAGYNMYVSLVGTLRGKIIPAYKQVNEEINEVLFNMADWFYNNRIKAEPKKYEKFKIKSTDINSPDN